MQIEESKIFKFSNNSWAREIACEFHKKASEIVTKKGNCDFLLTGGRTAKEIYLQWKGLNDFSSLKDIKFYLGDERCVDENHPDSNYRMMLESLFINGIPKGCTLSKIFYEDKKITEIIDICETNFPENPDILILSLGEDGHIASIFPETDTLFAKGKIAYFQAERMIDRLTITPKILQNSKDIIVLVQGEIKRNKFLEILSSKKDIRTHPAHLLEDASWYLID